MFKLVSKLVLEIHLEEKSKVVQLILGYNEICGVIRLGFPRMLMKRSSTNSKCVGFVVKQAKMAL